MAKITSIYIQKNNKERCNLFIDGEFKCGLSLEIALKNNLKTGLDVSEDELIALIKENERAAALNKAIDYVSKTLKTKYQVKTYLQQKGYDMDTVWYCVDKLKEYGYIDDKAFCLRYIEYYQKTQGKRLMESKLMQKGVSREDIALAFSEVEVSGKDSAFSVCEKYLKNKEKTRENVFKAFRYLIGKGFSYEDAEYATKKIEVENGKNFDY